MAKIKTMLAADKKLAKANLATTIKTHGVAVKAIATDLKAAGAVLAAAKKAADGAVKQAGKDLAAAQKVFAAAQAKADKQTAAAAKGTDKLTAQMAALDAVPLATAPKAVKLPKVETVTASPNVVSTKAMKPRAAKAPAEQQAAA